MAAVPAIDGAFVDAPPKAAVVRVMLGHGEVVDRQDVNVRAELPTARQILDHLCTAGQRA